MATTFWADCTVFRECNKDTARYLKEQWGVELRSLSEAELEQGVGPRLTILGVVVRDYPEIMNELEHSGYFRESPLWQISRISGQGMTLYLVNHSGKSEDGNHDRWEEVFIFLPMSNIVAIHNVSQQFFINESLRAMDQNREPGRE